MLHQSSATIEIVIMKELQYVISLENKLPFFSFLVFLPFFPPNVGMFPKHIYEAVRCVVHKQD